MAKHSASPCSPLGHTHVSFIAFGQSLPPPCVYSCVLPVGAVCSSQFHQLLTPSLSAFESPCSSSVTQAPVFTCGIVFTAQCGDILCTATFPSDPLPPMLYIEGSSLAV